MILMLRLLLGTVLLLFLAGRFLPGPTAWGFNHLAYLPGWVTPVWAVLAAALLVPAVQGRLARLLETRCSRILWERRWAVWVLPLLAGGLFALLRERSFFMGDGYLIGELADRGVMFRAFDSLDYLLHFQALKALKSSGSSISAFTVYRIASVLAGMAAMALYIVLMRRLDWEPWRKTAALALLFFLGPVALFFGYVESYSFLFLFLTSFLLVGLGALEGRFPLWLAAGLFGLGFAFHLTALFSAPALLILALRAPVKPASSRWLQVVLPPVLLFALAVALHFAEGYNTFWMKKEFVDNKNAHSILLSFTTDRGLLSFYHWKDLWNLALITSPACLALVLSRMRGIRERLGDPGVLFLVVQICSVLLVTLLVDRKLGGARDWDLFAAHSAGLVLLASLFLPAGRDEPEPVPSAGSTRPHPAVAMLVGTAFLTAAPWVLLLHLEERSIDRFVSVAEDFPAFARAYAYEEVGKYYRKAAEADTTGERQAELMAKAEEMYELCVSTYPGNMRFRILLGAVYYTQDKLDLAEEEYLHVAERDSTNYMAFEMLGKLRIRREKYEEALPPLRRLVRLRPTKAEPWELLGFAAMKANRPEEVLEGLGRAMELDPRMQYDHEVGVALLRMGRNLEAAASFQRALDRGQRSTPTRIGLAWALVSATEAARKNGIPASPTWLDLAEEQLRIVLGVQPEDPEATNLMNRIQRLR